MVKVIEPLDTVKLTYDWANNDGRLGFVHTNYPNYHGVEVNQIHKLEYGDYLNSLGETESVLVKVRQSTNFGDVVLENTKLIRTCVQCPVYDSLDAQMIAMGGNSNANGGTI